MLIEISTVHVQNSSSIIMSNAISINPQQDTQNDQDFLKALFDQQNRNGIHLGDLSILNQSSDASSLASMESVSMNDDFAVGDVDGSTFLLNLLHHKLI